MISRDSAAGARPHGCGATGEAIGERLARDREALLPLPPAPYDACDKRPGRVRSLSLVRYRDNDYSVPVAYGYREVVIRGYVDQVVIGCGAEGIARHRRSYEREDLVFDPLHYLPLIERKIGALDQAAPLVNDLGFVKTIDGLGQSIVIRVADAAHRGFDARFRQALGIFDRDILGEFNRSSQHSGIGGCYDGTQTAVGSVWTEQVAFARSTGLGTA